MAQSPYYAGHQWPDYKFVEFPKWVNGVLVKNSDEEAAVPASVVESSAAAGVDVAALMAEMAEMKAKLASMTLDADGVDERAELIGQAEAHGVTIDRRWGVEKLRAALAGI